MVPFRLCLLLAALCACCSLGAVDAITTPKALIIDVAPVVSSNPAPVDSMPDTSAPATDDSEEKKKTTTSTTSAPTTTTSAPTTTTSAPTTTTTPAPATTTTLAPTTTSTPKPAPAPAPAPGPIPPPEQGTWSYNDKGNVTCVLVQFAAQLNVTYTKVVNNVTSNAYVILNVPANATVAAGSCEALDQFITLLWPVGSGDSNNTMTLIYLKNDTLKSYSLMSVYITLSPECFVNASSNATVELNHGVGWQTPLATSYRCAAPTRYNMTLESGSGGAALTLSRLQEEAFRTTNGTGFSAARECGGGDVPDAVPIAVGCALGGLVVVVLVAYLVGRRRSAARGYLSM